MAFFGIRRPSLLGVTKLLQFAIYYLGKIFFMRTRISVEGMHCVSGLSGNAIFAANHANEIDPAVICLALDRAGLLRTRIPVIFLSREKAFYGDMGFIKARLYGGLLFRIFGAYPVTPKDKRKTPDSHSNTLATHIALLAQGYSVIISPEGTRTKTGKLLPAKAGVAILSDKSGRPVIPIAIDGTFRLSFMDFWAGKKEVRVTFGAPLPLYRHKNPRATANSVSEKKEYIRRAGVVMWCIRRLLYSHTKTKG